MDSPRVVREKPKVPLLVDEPQNDCGSLEIRHWGKTGWKNRFELKISRQGFEIFQNQNIEPQNDCVTYIFTYVFHTHEIICCMYII